MARAARTAGLAWIVLTDHSPSLGVTRGLSPERVAEQREEIGRLNAVRHLPYSARHRDGDPRRRHAGYPDDLLAAFDVVVASVHTARG